MRGRLWVVTVFFNAAGYKAPVRNYQIFSKRMAGHGVSLLTVELAFGQHPFCLPDGPNVHRLRGESVLWQKERLINHAVGLLPDECDKVAWVDADILWPDGSWVERASDSLDRHFDVVQLFEGVFRLYPGQEEWTEKNPTGQALWWEPSTALHLVNGWPFPYTAMGFAWAARRSWLGGVKLYERCILGGGDFVFLNAIFDRNHPWGHAPLDDDIAAWRAGVRATRPRVGYVAGTICHLFHGNVKDRRYTDRHLILKEHAYRPAADVYEINHVFEWATHKPGLHRAVLGYFLGRREDAGRADG